ncbi:hypothetical protein BLA17378_01177 [Burkholderia aenigmatica]|uniref:Uncharacterized protein n=1 Tax=Burkholderia aenigmatica TaxID=2015348 RepID=A0ABY6XS16_9BURK|nr:hypothetical protein BLA17378_01177 [Burkholderia aenigmatica]VWC71247.1 hypothetical protein BLA18628_00532 [Burkholderia aenigmatica]
MERYLIEPRRGRDQSSYDEASEVSYCAEGDSPRYFVRQL